MTTKKTEMQEKILAQKDKYYESLKKSTAEFESMYGEEADSVMQSTAMNMAKKKFASEEACDPVTKKAKELEESSEEKFTITMVQQALADMDVDTFVKNGMLYVRGTKADGERAQKTLAQAGLKMAVRLTEEENDVGQFYKKLGEAAAEKGLSLSQLSEALKAMEKEASKEATEAFNAKKGKMDREKKSGDTIVNPMIGESKKGKK